MSYFAETYKEKFDSLVKKSLSDAYSLFVQASEHDKDVTAMTCSAIKENKGIIEEQLKSAYAKKDYREISLGEKMLKMIGASRSRAYDFVTATEPAIFENNNISPARVDMIKNLNQPYGSYAPEIVLWNYALAKEINRPFLSLCIESMVEMAKGVPIDVAAVLICLKKRVVNDVAFFNSIHIDSEQLLERAISQNASNRPYLGSLLIVCRYFGADATIKNRIEAAIKNTTGSKAVDAITKESEAAKSRDSRKKYTLVTIIMSLATTFLIQLLFLYFPDPGNSGIFMQYFAAPVGGLFCMSILQRGVRKYGIKHSLIAAVFSILIQLAAVYLQLEFKTFGLVVSVIGLVPMLIFSFVHMEF